MSDPSVTVGGQSFETTNTSITVSQLALFGAWYPDPTGGFNIQGLLGYAGAEVTVDNVTREVGTDGISLGIGLGYDFWISREWSIGPSARLTYAHLTDSEDGVELRHRFLSPTIGFSATHH